jgi:hypothetical protein
MIIRDLGNSFQLSDWTREVNIIPNTWGTIGNLGIFTEEPVAEHVVQFQEVNRDFGLVVDRVRGDRSNFNKDYKRKLHTFSVPHFPLDDAILPKDIQGRSAYTNLSEAETLEGVRMRRMERIRNSHAVTLEYARAVALTTGNVYAPNGTVSQNWFTEFGVTQTVVDFLLGTAGTNVISKVEAGISAIQDNAGMVSITGVVALCSPTFFAKLISHSYVTTAYQYYTVNGAQQPLRNRLSPDSSAVALHRTFEYGGCLFIEMRDQYAGNQLIPAGDAVMVPTGTDYFRTYFSPAERFFTVNTLGEQVYMFETQSMNGTSIEIETESNYANALLKPALVVRLTTSN